MWKSGCRVSCVGCYVSCKPGMTICANRDAWQAVCDVILVANPGCLHVQKGMLGKLYIMSVLMSCVNLEQVKMMVIEWKRCC